MRGPETVQLGQFTDEHAELIVDRLEAAGITWWLKRSGGLTRWLSAGDWGTRVFVDAERRREAVEIARAVTASG